MRRKETANDKDEESFCSFVWKGAWCQQNRARPIVLVFNVHKKEGKRGGGGDQVTLKSSIVFKNVELSLALWYKWAERVTGGQIKCFSPQIKKLY